jgi:hypothetical protein
MKKVFLICLLSILTTVINGQITLPNNNQTTPVLYGGKHYSYKNKHALDSIARELKRRGLFSQKAKSIADSLIKKGAVRTELDLLSIIPGSTTIYYGHNGIYGKKMLLDLCKRVAKHPVFRDIDSFWFEYFRDTLTNIKNIRQYSGFSLCIGYQDTMVMKERLEIPISNSGRFYKKHFNRKMDFSLLDCFNRYLTLKYSNLRLASFSMPPIYESGVGSHPISGNCFVLVSRAQVGYLSKARLNKNLCSFGYSGFLIDFSGFNTIEYSNKLIAALDSSHVIAHYNLATQRSIRRIIRENNFNGFSEIIHRFNIGGTVMMQWGPYPGVHKSNLQDIAQLSRGKLKFTGVRDNYSSTKTDSFSITFTANGTRYASMLPKNKQPNPDFYRLLGKCIKEQLPGYKLHIGFIPGIGNWVCFVLKENEIKPLVDLGLFLPIPV